MCHSFGVRQSSGADILDALRRGCSPGLSQVLHLHTSPKHRERRDSGEEQTLVSVPPHSWAPWITIYVSGVRHQGRDERTSHAGLELAASKLSTAFNQ